jgi:LPS sulfotransferase NodH
LLLPRGGFNLGVSSQHRALVEQDCSAQAGSRRRVVVIKDVEQAAGEDGVEPLAELRQLECVASAVETKVWRSSDVFRVAQIEPSFNFEAIRSLVQLCSWEDQAWQGYFGQNAIEPCRVLYEDLLESPDAVARQVLSYLDVQTPDPLFPEGAWRHQRQSNAVSDEWLERYKAREHATR